MKMAGEELQIVRLRDDFYRDGFYKVLFSLFVIVGAIVLLIVLSAFIFFSKPAPVRFSADPDWRILPSVPVDQVYLNSANLVQWISEVLPDAFTVDFVNYPKQLKEKTQYFTNEGWKKFLEQVNVYANFNSIQKAKQFLNASAGAAPVILNQGLLNGRYAWWVQMPINLNYITYQGSYTKSVMFNILIVRVPTLNNLYGVGIDNLVLANPTEAAPGVAGQGRTANE